jgi:Ca2+-binding RTX toxin-like protein
LTLTNANFAGTPSGFIGVFPGGTGDTVDASAVTAPNGVIIYAFSGNNTLFGGGALAVFVVGSGANTMTGGAGQNSFAMTTPDLAAPDVITNFVSGPDHLVFTNSTFDLGIDNGLVTETFTVLPLDPSLVAFGGFTAPTQRLAYDQAAGNLFYDPFGSSNPAAQVLIDKLGAGTPLAAGDFLFTK